MMECFLHNAGKADFPHRRCARQSLHFCAVYLIKPPWFFNDEFWNNSISEIGRLFDMEEMGDEIIIHDHE